MRNPTTAAKFLGRYHGISFGPQQEPSGTAIAHREFKILPGAEGYRAEGRGQKFWRYSDTKIRRLQEMGVEIPDFAFHGPLRADVRLAIPISAVSSISTSPPRKCST